MSKSYSEKLKDPRWQKKRLEILDRDKWTCKICGETEITLHVHHIFYLPKIEPWDVPSGFLLTVCEDCHFNKNDEEYHPMDSLVEQVDVFLSTFWRCGYSPDDLKMIGLQINDNIVPDDKILSALFIEAHFIEE